MEKYYFTFPTNQKNTDKFVQNYQFLLVFALHFLFFANLLSKFLNLHSIKHKYLFGIGPIKIHCELKGKNSTF